MGELSHGAEGATHTALLHSYAAYLEWLDAALIEVKGEPQGARLAARSSAAESAHATESGGSPRLFSPGQRFIPFEGAPEFVVLPFGAVELGALPTDPDAQPSERPRRVVQIVRPIAMSIAPVTFDQWDACLADDGTRHRPNDATWGRGSRPVMNVSWYDAEEYCGWLGRKSDMRCRLPSEAEWEYAFWAGQPQAERFPWGHDLGFRQLRHHAWFSENAGLRTQAVGQLQVNPWGLVDLLGNVAEWVADAHHPDLSRVPLDGRAYAGEPKLARRVIKGGSWLESARAVRPSARDHHQPDYRGYRVGFRVMLELPVPLTA